jgi:hypothetical protein
VTVVEGHRDGLRRDQATEPRGGRELPVPVDRVRVVHRHHPATDVGGAAGVLQLATADRLADAVIHVRQVEAGNGGRYGFLSHLLSMLGVTDVHDDVATEATPEPRSLTPVPKV